MKEEVAVEAEVRWEANNAHRTIGMQSIRKDIEEDISTSLTSYLKCKCEIPVTITSMKYVEGYVDVSLTFHEDPKESCDQFKNLLPTHIFNALEKLVKEEIEEDIDSDLLNFTIPYEEEWCHIEDRFIAAVYKRVCHIEVLDMKFIPEFYGQQRFPF